MSAPVRIQRQRTRGWKMPEGAIYVGRPTRWGNPFSVGVTYGASGPNGEWSRTVKIRTRADAVAEYRRAAELGVHPSFPSDFLWEAQRILGGHDLACWCPLDEPCHADELLKFANPAEHKAQIGGTE